MDSSLPPLETADRATTPWVTGVRTSSVLAGTSHLERMAADPASVAALNAAWARNPIAASGLLREASWPRPS
jgi:hypothetical protein